jgi:predicted ABC-type transport system involved in lysophospholipase L1 biosynthesis ATPase subunit
LNAGHDLSLRDLTVIADRRTVVDRLTLRVAAGSTLVVTGPAGSGKSLLLATLAGLRRPATGQVWLGDRPVRADLIGHAVGYVPQIAEVFGTLTAVENVALPLLARGIPATDAWVTAERHLEDLGLSAGVRHNLAEQLSGGQRQRVAFARATVGRPLLLVADDPTSELDPGTAERTTAIITGLAAAGSSVVLATTDTDLAGRADLTLDLAGQAGRTLPAPTAEPGR